MRGKKMDIQSITIASNADMSTSLESLPFAVDYLLYAGIQAAITGSPVGTMRLLASVAANGWSEVSGSSSAVSGAGNVIWNIENMGFTHLKVSYDRVSGSGNVTITAYGKGGV